MNKIPCALCQKTADLKHSHHEGYQQGKFYSVYHCAACQTAFAYPTQIDHELYNLIYKNKERLSGYSRYERYAKEILQQEKPLEYLANQEEVYWGIAEFLKNRSKQIKILEIGCGLGYLTYALNQSGFDATGLDISKIAIENAVKLYGPHFICTSLENHVSQHVQKYDLIIFTEVIEHIPDIHPFLENAKTLLKPSGELILTTPNRSCYPDHVLWETEPPPVHLWWFSEQSIQRLASIHGLKVQFLDFSSYSQKPTEIQLSDLPLDCPTRKARIDRMGQIIDPVVLPKDQQQPWRKTAKKWLKKIGLFDAVQSIRHPKNLKTTEPATISYSIAPSRSYSICAILTVKDQL